MEMLVYELYMLLSVTRDTQESRVSTERLPDRLALVHPMISKPDCTTIATKETQSTVPAVIRYLRKHSERKTMVGGPRAKIYA